MIFCKLKSSKAGNLEILLLKKKPFYIASIQFFQIFFFNNIDLKNRLIQ